MRILFDQGTPVPIRAFLTGHSVTTAAREGWDRLQNGDLLDVAEAAGYDVLLTTDKNLRHQQNLKGRKIAIVVVLRQQWPELKQHVHLVVDAVNAATAGSCVEVDIP
jgi:predicted nuclease of predicted toxin-antitoxin system